MRLSNKVILQSLRGFKLPFSPTSLRSAIKQIVEELPAAILGPQVKRKNEYVPIFLGIIVFVFFFRQSIWHQIYDGKIYDEGFISDLIWRNFSYTTDLIIPNNYLSVSYTHLTLPTILRV